MCMLVGETQECNYFLRKVEQGQGEQLQTATSELCKVMQRCVLSSSVDRAEIAISNSYQLFRLT